MVLASSYLNIFSAISLLMRATPVICTDLLIPLYQWPADNTTWAPVSEAASMYSNLSLKVIINPNSGPGDSDFPERAYLDAVARLVPHTNIEILGYVQVEYAARQKAKVEQDIWTYQGWSRYKMQNITISGVFFDQAPHGLNNRVVQYMKDVSSVARDAGFGTIVFNPGSQVVGKLRSEYMAYADLVVEFEGSYSQSTCLMTTHTRSGNSSVYGIAALVYDVPIQVDYRHFLQQLKQQMRLAAVYLTADSGYKSIVGLLRLAMALDSVDT